MRNDIGLFCSQLALAALPAMVLVSPLGLPMILPIFGVQLVAITIALVLRFIK